MMSMPEMVERVKIGRSAAARWPFGSAQWNYHTGYVRAYTEVLADHSEIVEEDGCLFINGSMLDASTADARARQLGFQFAEELVEALRGISP